jgi:ABC-type dipeptide/oligopeptide/nickel transport system ATPase subunit
MTPEEMEQSEYTAPSLLRQVSEWKLEAKFEDNERYFFSMHEESQLLSGSKSFVIGRKGSGKTALSERIRLIESRDGGNCLSEKLSFKNFPFNELYALHNDSYTKPNQYITIWKYVIYSCICQMMLRDKTLDEDIRDTIKKIYGNDVRVGLKRLIPQWVSKEFSIEFSGQEEA